MKITFMIMIILHGVIHLIGFFKAFNLYKIQLLTRDITRLSGSIWLVASTLFLITALFFASKNSYWWLWGLMALLCSQLLIINYWEEAKYGTIINFIVLISCLYGYFTWSYYHKFKIDVRTGLQQKDYFDNTIISERDIEHLPTAVKKYLYYTGSVGKPKVNNFYIEFKGEIRKNEESEWMPFTSQQYNFMETPTRLFFMEATMKHLPVTGYHCYANGNAFMDIRFFSLFRVQFKDGHEMNKAETVTFFNDMCCMAPPTLIDKRIKWENTTDNSVKATFTNNNISVTAHLFFNETGQLINFKSDDRYNADAGKILPWSTPLKNYREINGYKLAGYANAIYSYSDRDLCYGNFEIKDIKYNVNSNN